MNEKDIICQYAKELKLATVRENLSLFEPTEKVHKVKWINNWAQLTGLLRKV